MGDEWSVHGVSVRATSSLDGADYDAVVVLLSEGAPRPAALDAFIASALALDPGLAAACAVLPCDLVSGRRLVLSPTGPLTEYDDVRSVGEAARAGVRRAMAAGARKPAVALLPHPRWPRSELVALLGALEALYVPLQIRESFPALGKQPEALGVFAEGARTPLPTLLRDAVALEVARGVARDVGGADPERMTPGAAAELLRGVFAGGGVGVRVLDDADVIKQQYPLFAAVTRAADAVPRHKGCVVFLEYVPKKYEKTLMFVGKGVTYDTGGCDIKAGGVMAGMSRDKCGAAAVAGFLKACELLKPELKVVAALGMVRNSVGEEAYVADELLKCRRGLAVRVGNTDAEGRMVMADLLAEGTQLTLQGSLCLLGMDISRDLNPKGYIESVIKTASRKLGVLNKMVERAANEPSPHLYTVATLTGHAHRAYGDGYTAAMDNHVAAASDHADKLRRAGDSAGDMLEVSRLRREDIAAHRGRGDEQVFQADNKPSTACARGHQAPAAFLLLCSGLEAAPLPYTHLDVAASAGSLPHAPTGAPIVALAAAHGLIH